MYANQRDNEKEEDNQEMDPQAQHWTVHAEFTISHDGLAEQGIGPPTTVHTERDENGGVRLVYRWTSVQTHPTVDEPRNTETTTTTTTKPHSGGGYVRNILNKFAPQQQENPPSSGYSSEQLMSPSNNGGRSIQPYNKRCRSTCSIVLSTNVQQQQTPADIAPSRTQSLRCQTPPTSTCPKNKEVAASSSLYGCGDPWCYHSPHYDERLARFSPLIEADDEYAINLSTKSKNSATFLSTNTKTCRDASVQTYEMVDKCTSPLIPKQSSDVVSGKLSLGVVGAPKKRPPAYLTRRKTEPIRRTNKGRDQQLLAISPDSLDTKQDDVKGAQTDKKSRTVHIDVYCTGTERESSSSSTSSHSSTSTTDDNTNEQVSSPQTVFESSDVRITHVRADSKALPQRIMPREAQAEEEEEEEDVDVDSSSYPSRLSSYSTLLRDFDRPSSSLSSSFSTNPWSRMSLSSCDTSWKDTGSDLVSLLGSRSNRLIGGGGGVEPIIREEDTATTTTTSPPLRGDHIAPQTPSSTVDSFEYAASDDKVRIRRLNEDLIKWRSPQIERQKMLQQQKSSNVNMAEDSHSTDDDSSLSDQSGKGWSFVKTSLAREDTIKQRLPLPQQKSPSVLIVKQKLTENPELRAPFTRSPGVFTEQRQIARKFGRIIDVYRKPGHHIGPAKNPDCSCDHCTEYFGGGFGRGRTQSVGGSGVAATDYYSWKRGGNVRGAVVGRGSEPPQSREQIQLQLERDGQNTAIYGLTRNGSLSNI